MNSSVVLIPTGLLMAPIVTAAPATNSNTPAATAKRALLCPRRGGGPTSIKFISTSSSTSIWLDMLSHCWGGLLNAATLSKYKSNGHPGHAGVGSPPTASKTSPNYVELSFRIEPHRCPPSPSHTLPKKWLRFWRRVQHDDRLRCRQVLSVP